MLSGFGIGYYEEINHNQQQWPFFLSLRGGLFT
jgi:hypothetical protein